MFIFSTDDGNCISETSALTMKFKSVVLVFLFLLRIKFPVNTSITGYIYIRNAPTWTVDLSRAHNYKLYSVNGIQPLSPFSENGQLCLGVTTLNQSPNVTAVYSSFLFV